jgi:fumarate reductase subunit C
MNCTNRLITKQFSCLSKLSFQNKYMKDTTTSIVIYMFTIIVFFVLLSLSSAHFCAVFVVDNSEIIVG